MLALGGLFYAILCVSSVVHLHNIRWKCNIYVPIPGASKFHDYLQNCSNLSKYLNAVKSIISKLYVSTQGENKVFDTDARSRFRFRWNPRYPFVYVSYKVPFRIASICLLIQSSPTFIKCNFTRIVDCRFSVFPIISTFINQTTSLTCPL